MRARGSSLRSPRTTSSSATATSRRTRRTRARSSRAPRGERLLDWLEEVEYGEFGLPRPDLVVLLDAPVALARELVGRKAARGYTTLEADIHEADAGHSGATREVYLELGRRNGWRVVSTEGEDGAPRDVGRGRRRGLDAVEPLLR